MSSPLHDSGVRFIEYLRTSEERISVQRLRGFYNGFRGRVHPSFSKVLNALERSNKIFIKNSMVYLRDEPQPREYCDLRRRPRAPQRQNPICGPEEPAAPSPGPSTAVAPALTPRNLASRVLKELQVNRKTLMADKKGIEITSNPESSEGKVQYIVETLRKAFLIRFHIENNGPDTIEFTYYTALPRSHCFTLEDEKRVTRACPVSLNPGESYEVEARYKLKYHGYFSAMIYFEFLPVDTKSASEPFSIVREMVAATRTPLAAELGPVAPYKPHRRFAHKPVTTMLVQVEFPERHRHVHVFVEKTVKLGAFKCPHYLKRLAKQNLEDSENLSPADRSKLVTVKSHLRGPLEMKNYFHRFNRLLHLEEIQVEVEIGKYNLQNQTMTRDQSNRKLLTLIVPGVAEDRPSVLRGDCLKVSKSGDTSDPLPVYPGYVHKVELDSVKLSFSQKLLEVFNSNMKFDVEFTLNRYTLMLQHRAVDLAAKYNLEDVLFPSGAAATNPSLPILRMFDRDLENNPEQRAAVQHIVAGSSKPAPYLVFGPPGTGKTSTLVEAMYQVIVADPSARILACAPSNNACDLMWERLMEPMDRQLVYRVYADSRDPRTVPEHLLEYCNWDKKKENFVFPGKETLMNFKIVVTTMFTAGRLVSKGIQVGHFTHVFVDEGGQAEEPQCVIAVAGLLNPQKGQLVLAGDPMQLGPIIHSRLASHHGLGLSLLERLMKYNDLYKTSKDPRFVTKLLRNYRSHAAILKIPNELFYDNEVQEFADQLDREAYCNWEPLPKEGFPVIFHGVIGKDEREANSPSYFNVSEIEVIVEYLSKLMETQEKNGLPKLSAKHIGIIAPYRKQVEKIQKALKSAAALRQWSEVKEIKVGCVEAFQGDERRIIMVSTVRSSINCVKMDKDFNIGFLSNPKRFNVAVTRAGSLLIVVGNPVILNKDPTWEKFISYCVKEKGYTGFDLKDVESEDDDVLFLAALNICVDSEHESPLQQRVDP